MPKYRVRLESPDMMQDDGSPHCRVTTLTVADEDAARWVCEQKEAELCIHQYSSDDLAVLEQKEADAEEAGERLPGAIRGRLAAHRQTQPFEIVSVEEVGS